MICFDKIIAVLLGEMAGSGNQLVQHTRIGRCFLRHHHTRVGAVLESLGKEPAGGCQVPLLRHQYVDDLAALLDRSVQIDPAPGEPSRFVGKPPITGNVPAGSGRVDQHRSEPLHPAVNGDVIDGDAADQRRRSWRGLLDGDVVSIAVAAGALDGHLDLA